MDDQRDEVCNDDDYEQMMSLQSRRLWSVNHFFFNILQNQFVVDDVSKIIKEAIETTIGGNAYQHEKVNQWTSAVVENCLTVLTKLQKPYKYIGMYCCYWWPPSRLNVDSYYLFDNFFFSYLHDNAKERCWFAYGQFMLLE